MYSYNGLSFQNRWAQSRPEYSEEAIILPVAMVRMPWHHPIITDASGPEERNFEATAAIQAVPATAILIIILRVSLF